MTVRTVRVGLAVFFTAVCARAADRTWSGDGSDAKWSTSANWGGTAIAENDTLYFGGTTRLANTNDLTEGTSFAGIIFNTGAGAFKLGGNGLTLNGGVTNLSAAAQTFNLSMALTNSCVFNASLSNVTITANGMLSGSGDLMKTGFGTLTLTASNSYDGVTTVNDGILWITNDNALGSTNGNTVVNGKTKGNGNLQLSGGIVVAEPLVLYSERLDAKSSLYNFSGSNTWSGPITRQNQVRIHGAASSTLVISGGVTGTGGHLVLNSPGTIVVQTQPVNIGANSFYLESSGLTVIGVAGNVWGSTSLYGGNGVVRLDIPNALPATSVLYLGYSAATATTINLNGCDQTVGELKNRAPSTAVQRITNTSATPATLTVNQSATNLFDGQLSGLLGLTKIGTGTLTLSNSLSTTTGNITVTNGTLVVAAANSLGNSTNITVSGGTLELRASSGIADTASLVIENDGQVNIGAGLVETVNMLFFGGAQQQSGTWGTTGSGAAHIDDTYLTGNGKLLVLAGPLITPVNATWNAGGGSDTLMSTADNWEGSVLPASNGSAHTIFGTGGTTATVDTAINLYAMTFNRAGNFLLENGAGAITLGAGGITAAIPDTTSRTYTLAEDLTLAEHATWDVATNGTGVATLIASGNVSNGIDPRGFSKTGNGTLVLSGSNSYDGVTIVDNGLVSLTHSRALGSTNGNTVINGPSGGCAQLSGNIVVAEPLVLNGERVHPASTGGLWSLYNASGTNTLSGPIIRQGLQTRIEVGGNSALIFRGGVLGGNSQFVVNIPNTSLMAFYDNPVNIGTLTFYVEGEGLTVIGVGGNTWGGTRLTGNGIMRLEVANALPAAAKLQFGYSDHINNCTLNLNGFDQTTGLLDNTAPKSGAPEITSPSPATLTVDQSANTLFSGQLNGALNLAKIGSGTLILSNSLSSTTGNITVTNGTLAVAADNSLGNSTNITVTGVAARLELRTSSGITNTATLLIADNGAKVNLAAGVNESVRYLYFGEKRQRVGTYGSGSSTATIKDNDHFSGSGVLTVLRDDGGTLIQLK